MATAKRRQEHAVGDLEDGSDDEVVGGDDDVEEKRVKVEQDYPSPLPPHQQSHMAM